MSEHKENIYFPGLNGLRFMAAFSVVLSHIELLKGELGFEHSWKNVFFFYGGGLGVYFFFVLSGFLITYLLLAEKTGSKTISIKNFYIRRALRIWPLYYLLTLLGFFVFPNIDFLHLPFFSKALEDGFSFKFISYLLMLPNLALSLFHPVPHVGQLWSIGVEEQFYLFWPIFILLAKNIFKSLLLFLIAIISLKAGILLYGQIFQVPDSFQYVHKFAAMNKFECMIIGSAGAYLVYTKHKILKVTYYRITQWIALCSIPILLFFTSESIIQDGTHLLYSVLFLIVIINVSGNQNSVLRLENKVFDNLGKISYGIYMYHMFIVVLVVKAISFTFNTKQVFDLTQNFLIYFLTTALTIFVSYLSYHFFEKKFIKLKLVFSKIVSGDMVKRNKE